MQPTGSKGCEAIWRVGVLLEASFHPQLQKNPMKVLACPALTNQLNLNEGEAIALCKQHLLKTYELANEYTTPGVSSDGYELKESKLNLCKYPSVVIAPASVLDKGQEDLSAELKFNLTAFEVRIGLPRSMKATLLLVSRHFLRIYGLFSEEVMWFRQLNPVPLDQITLVPASKDPADLSESHIEESVRQLYLHCQKEVVTVQQGFDFVFQVHFSPDEDMDFDSLSAETEIFAVTKASPVLQGRITDQTIITVIPSRSDSATPMPSQTIKPKRKVTKAHLFAEDSDGETYFDAEEESGSWRRTGSGASASDFRYEQSLVLSEVVTRTEGPGDYHTQVTAASDFRLHSHYIVLPKDRATKHSIFHCQTVWVCAAEDGEKSITARALSNLVFPLYSGLGVEGKQWAEKEKERKLEAEKEGEQVMDKEKKGSQGAEKEKGSQGAEKEKGSQGAEKEKGNQVAEEEGHQGAEKEKEGNQGAEKKEEKQGVEKEGKQGMEREKVGKQLVEREGKQLAEKEGKQGTEKEGERMHLAIAILYENEAELEKYVPPGVLGRKSDLSAHGSAFIHPSLLFFLFPETLSSTRKFFVNIRRISKDPEIPLIKKWTFSIINQPVEPNVDVTSAFKYHVIDQPLLLSAGEIRTIQTRSGKLYGRIELLDPSVNGAASLSKIWECRIPSKNTSSYLPDLIPPSPLFPTPCYWEHLQPAGLEDYCETLFSYFIPLLRRSSNCPPSSVLVSGPPGCGKRVVVRAVARQCRMHLLERNCYDFSNEVVAYAERNFVLYFKTAFESAPVVFLLHQVHMLGKKNDTDEEVRLGVEFEKAMEEVAQLNRSRDYPVMVIGVTSQPQRVPLRVHGSFLHHLQMAAPSQPQREAMLVALARERHVSPEIEFRDLAKRTAGFVLGDFVAMYSHATHLAFRDVTRHCLASVGRYSGEDLAIAGTVVTQHHLETALDTLHSAHSDAIGAPKIPSVQWDDVGGLVEAKREILDTIQLPLLHPELFTAGLRRSGVLLYGAPGTGKTLLAKAVATECSLNFLSVKGPELINMYVGQSEENIREVFTRARSAAPCVIFFDELDSIAPNRGKSGDSGGVMDRVVSQLLAELDGLEKSEDVFVIGATNRPDLLDPALLRPGRFDRLVYLGVSDDVEARLKILKAITRKFSLDGSVDLQVLAKQCPANLTGADLYALCSNATLTALRRQIETMEQQNISDEEWMGRLVVTQDDFLEALDKLTPSVSAEELEHYKDIKKSIAS